MNTLVIQSVQQLKRGSLKLIMKALLERSLITALLISKVVFVLAQNPKVGIGTSNPQRSLHVSGDIRFDTLGKANNTGIIMHNNSGDISSLSFPGNASLVLSGAGTWVTPTGGGSGLPTGTIVLSDKYPNNELITAGFAYFGKTKLGESDVDSVITTTPGTWARLPVAEAPDLFHTKAIWAQDRMILYNGMMPYGKMFMFVLSTSTWVDIPAIPRNLTSYGENFLGYSAVWTGSALIVWGGERQDTYQAVGEGFSYNPFTNEWTKISSINAPSPRFHHFAKWTGAEMIIWGGRSSCYGCYQTTGAKYDPATNTWTTISNINAPAGRTMNDGQDGSGEFMDNSIWTGSEFIIWGGHQDNTSPSTFLSTGGKYNPASNTWQSIPAPPADVLTARSGHSMVWTGSEILIFGGFNETGGKLNDGALYNPITNSWRKISQTNAPSPRSGHAAVWTGSNMIAFGGTGGDDGAIYSPNSNTWFSIMPFDINPYEPSSSYYYNTVWTGDEMLTYGSNGGFKALGARYFTTTKTVTVPASPKTFYLYKKL